MSNDEFNNEIEEAICKIEELNTELYSVTLALKSIDSYFYPRTKNILDKRKRIAENKQKMISEYFKLIVKILDDE